MNQISTVMKKLPYQRRVTVAILLLALLPSLLLEWFIFSTAQTKWKREALESVQSEVGYLAEAVSEKVNEMSLISHYVQNNVELQRLLGNLKQGSLRETLDFIYQFDKQCNSFTAGNENLRVRFFPLENNKNLGKFCYSIEHFQNEFPNGRNDSDYSQIINLPNGTSCWKIRNLPEETKTTQQVISYLCVYTRIKNAFHCDVVLELSIPFDPIVRNVFQSQLSDFLLVISCGVDENNRYMLTQGKFAKEFGETPYIKLSELSDGNEIIEASVRDLQNGKVSFFVPDILIWKLLLPNVLSLAFVAILILVAVVAASSLMSHLLTHRIIDFVGDMNQEISRISAIPDEDIEGYDDISRIAHRIRKLLQDVQKVSVENEHLKEQENLMKLEILQMRFNPHFLYNTLGSIRVQVKDPAIRNSIDSLVRYYRIVLNNGHLVISIDKELEMVREYLRLEKFAYRLDNIDFEFQIDPNVSNYYMVKHLLQPVVENALKHGVRAAGNEGTIRICATVDDGVILFQIRDNGAGMTKEQTETLLQAPKSSTISGGYGLWNVQQRIHAYYGDEYGLDFHSELGKGTLVNLRIPTIENEDGHS